MSAASAAAVANHASAVGQYFGSVRVPSSFIAGASFAGLFTVKPPSQKPEKIENLFRYIYHFCIIMAFLLSINTVMVATAANTKNLHGDFDPVATSGYMLLKREFEYEFTMTRWCFFMALLMFLMATTNRILYEFKLFSVEPAQRERRRMIGTAVCLLMSSLVFHLVAFINSTLICWDSIVEMTFDLAKVNTHTTQNLTLGTRTHTHTRAGRALLYSFTHACLYRLLPTRDLGKDH